MTRSQILISEHVAQVIGFSQFIIHPEVKHVSIDKDCVCCTLGCQVIAHSGVLELISLDNGILSIVPSNLETSSNANMTLSVEPTVLGDFTSNLNAEPTRYFIKGPGEGIRSVVEIICT
jgi:hypothetical protein